MRRGAGEARRAHNPEVAGSNPAAATTTGPCVALPHETTGRALRDQPAPTPNGGPELPAVRWTGKYQLTGVLRPALVGAEIDMGHLGVFVVDEVVDPADGLVYGHFREAPRG